MRSAVLFHHLATKSARAVGHPVAFATAVAIVAIWAATGHFFHYSDTWQLVINTGTTIVTFLMVFLIQHTQNRDAEAMQLKLDELIKVNRLARNRLIALEDMSQEELDELHREFLRVTHDREAESRDDA
jgi:low affinity Fe/Cu permease